MPELLGVLDGTTEQLADIPVCCVMLCCVVNMYARREHQDVVVVCCSLRKSEAIKEDEKAKSEVEW